MVQIQHDMIREALKKKNITLKKMCEDLNLNYGSIRFKLGRQRFGTDMGLKVSEYLDIDFKELQTALINVKKDKHEVKNNG